jgi:hypothetical protein
MKLEQLNEKNANSYVRWSLVLVLNLTSFHSKTKFFSPYTPLSFVSSTVTPIPQDDFCILLSKNIEPEERKQAPPPVAAFLAPDTVANAPVATAAITGSAASSAISAVSALNPKSARPADTPSLPISLRSPASATFQPSSVSGGNIGGMPAAPAPADNGVVVGSSDDFPFDK